MGEAQRRAILTRPNRGAQRRALRIGVGTLPNLSLQLRAKYRTGSDHKMVRASLSPAVRPRKAISQYIVSNV
jgi:hypothetical protein